MAGMPDDHQAAAFDVGELIGLLADPDRLRVVAALVLGASDLDAVRKMSGLGARAAAKAMTRLVDSGLVLRADDGSHFLVEAAFRDAARVAAQRNPAPDEHAGAPSEQARVLRAFVRDGRLLSIPAPAGKRRVVLDWLAQNFEPGRHYSESMVNLIIGRYHADTAALRRYLVDEGFLDREAGEYWRTGGTVEV
jgi:hypothetical protein